MARMSAGTLNGGNSTASNQTPIELRWAGRRRYSKELYDMMPSCDTFTFSLWSPCAPAWPSASAVLQALRCDVRKVRLCCLEGDW